MINAFSTWSISRIFILAFFLFWRDVVVAAHEDVRIATPLRRWQRRQHSNQNGNGNKRNNNNGQKDTSLFNIINGQIYTPGLAIINAPQPFTPMGGDFLHISLDVSGNGKLQVPPQSTSDPFTQLYNITIFLTSNTLRKNFTISNITNNQAPPLANIMLQEPGSTVKHINFEWPACLVGDGKEAIGETTRGEYNISIHQNFRLNSVNYYSIFNLPISVTNSISQFPGASQLLTNPPPGPVNANGGRMDCESIENPMMDFAALVESVNNPPGQPYRDVQVQTASANQKGGGGQVGNPGTGNGGGNNGGNFGNGGGNQGNGGNNGGGIAGGQNSGKAMGLTSGGAKSVPLGMSAMTGILIALMVTI